jgi:hypothetical protein
MPAYFVTGPPLTEFAVTNPSWIGAPFALKSGCAGKPPR